MPEILLLPLVLLPGLLALGLRWRRERGLERGLREADFAQLARYLGGGVRRSSSEPEIRRLLGGMTTDRLIRLGDQARESGHPFAGTLFTAAWRILAERRRQQRAQERRLQAWSALRHRLEPTEDES